MLRLTKYRKIKWKKFCKKVLDNRKKKCYKEHIKRNERPDSLKTLKNILNHSGITGRPNGVTADLENGMREIAKTSHFN